jgi:hypothetical protein
MSHQKLPVGSRNTLEVMADGSVLHSQIEAALDLALAGSNRITLVDVCASLKVDPERVRELAARRVADSNPDLAASTSLGKTTGSRERRSMLGLNDDYEGVHEDPERWAQYLRERQDCDPLA